MRNNIYYCKVGYNKKTDIVVLMLNRYFFQKEGMKMEVRLVFTKLILITMIQKIHNYFNPIHLQHVWCAGSLNITDLLFEYQYLQNRSLHQNGLICPTKESAESLVLWLRLCAKVWQFATLGAYPNSTVLEDIEAGFERYFTEYEKPNQLELFHENIIELYERTKDPALYDEAGREYLRNVLDGLDKKFARKHRKKLNI